MAAQIEKVTKWIVPEGAGAPLLTMPNIPHPLHGGGCQPRTIVGPSEWKKMREACYAEHNDTCEVCGQKLSAHRNTDNPIHHCHEAFDYDYKEKTLTFRRLVCICPKCHSFIHSGRAVTMYKDCVPLWTKETLLEAAEHGFKLIQQWNKQHPDQPKLKCFQTIEEWLKEPTLTEDLQKLIDQYEIEFYYVPNTDTKSNWGKWKMVYEGQEYWSPYQSQTQWAAAMGKKQTKEIENSKNLFDPTEMDELAKLAESEGIF